MRVSKSRNSPSILLGDSDRWSESSAHMPGREKAPVGRSASLDGGDLNEGQGQADQEEADQGYGFGRSLSPAAADGGGRKTSEFDGFASAGYGFDASPAAPEDTPRGSTPPPELDAELDADAACAGPNTAAVVDEEEAKRLAVRAERLAKISRRRSIRKSDEERELYSALAIIDNLSEV